jgi:hypothetical protein
MNPSTTQPAIAPSGDEELTEQALPGHGIPSQDPDISAQVALNPEETERETKSALTGGGAVAGAAIGVAVAGPVGVMVGAALGAFVGALGGAAATDADFRMADSTAAESVRLHVEDSGGFGRPVVLIHGWPLSAQAWEPQVTALRTAGYRVVTYDRRGFGRSEKPESAYDYDVMADDLQHVLTQRDLQIVTLVGFSMGGGEVARYISRHGEARLHSVVFASAVPPYMLH